MNTGISECAMLLVLEVEETIIHPAGATGTSGLSSKCSRETLTATVSTREDDVPQSPPGQLCLGLHTGELKRAAGKSEVRRVPALPSHNRAERLAVKR